METAEYQNPRRREARYQNPRKMRLILNIQVSFCLLIIISLFLMNSQKSFSLKLICADSRFQVGSPVLVWKECTGVASTRA